MYIAIRQKGTDIILEEANFYASDYSECETLEEALEQMNSDIDDFMKYANETYEDYEDYYIQQID